MSASQNITLLGATGSIGGSTLDILSRHPDRYRLFAVSGYRRMKALAEICHTFQPVYAVVPDDSAAEHLRSQISELKTEVLVGEDALERVAEAPEADIVVAAIVGAAGLLPALAAVKAGKRILLANKEALVMSALWRGITAH